MTAFDRITQEAGVLGGKACLRGMRVRVGMIVGQIGAGRRLSLHTSVDDELYRESTPSLAWGVIRI
ncbi:MAG: DUF433 domain-containing protein [Acidobacteriia bacterium]|nr:DUF433 domain-containing protein [Terriglobia bacterium]